MSPASADSLINVLKSLVSVDRDAELADAFGVGKSTVASWRRRGVVPQSIIDKAKSDFGLTDEYVRRNLVEEAKTSHIMLGNAFYHAVLRLGATLSTEEVSDFAGLLYLFDDLIREALAAKAAPHPSSMGADAIPVLSAVMDGRLMSAEDLRAMLLDAQARSKAVPQKVPQSPPS